MSEPDPDFVKWFGGDWQRRLSAVAVPGMADASWDRKAAWLLWRAEHRKTPSAPSPRLFPDGNGVFD